MTGTADRVVPWQPGVRWQVICQDEAQWRVGIYSPPEASASDITELEQHDCPELFLLLEGELTIVCREANGDLREIALSRTHPVLVTSPHGGFCPGGPFTGVALVVERATFETLYTPLAPALL
ncbi:MAG TPA: hypothetical protein VM261_16625 [Kofleriaceae bacterium]|nr:hypothetical protein [Kofleriaceae bacterium]